MRTKHEMETCKASRDELVHDKPGRLELYLGMIIVLLLAGCIPQAGPASISAPTNTFTAIATTQAVETRQPAQTATSLRATMPILLPLPPDSISPLPFEGYKSADFGTAIDKFDQWMSKWEDAGSVGTDAVGGTLQLVPLQGGGVCAEVLSGSYFVEGETTLLCVGVDQTSGDLRTLPSGDITADDTADYPIFLELNPGESLRLVDNNIYQAVDAQGKPTRWVDKGQWKDGEYVSNEIVWSLKDPEAFPSQSFEYLTSTDFAQQVLDWETQGKFPEVPDTAVPLKTIEILVDTDKKFLNKYGESAIFGFPEIGAKAVGYEDHPEKVPYVLAGVWKTVYQGENASFVLQKWLNPDGSAGFQGYIYEPKSTNPLAITWELIDDGFGSGTRYVTGDYFSDIKIYNYKGASSCSLHFGIYGNPNSKFCQWYYGNPNVVFNREVYDRWRITGKLSNYITKDGKQVPFIPVSPISSLPFVPTQ